MKLEEMGGKKTASFTTCGNLIHGMGGEDRDRRMHEWVLTCGQFKHEIERGGENASVPPCCLITHNGRGSKVGMHEWVSTCAHLKHDIGGN